MNLRGDAIGLARRETSGANGPIERAASCAERQRTKGELGKGTCDPRESEGRQRAVSRQQKPSRSAGRKNDGWLALVRAYQEVSPPYGDDPTSSRRFFFIILSFERPTRFDLRARAVTVMRMA
jgi:hypothetical protein